VDKDGVMTAADTLEPSAAIEPSAGRRERAAGSVPLTVARRIGSAVLTLAVIVAVWVLFLKAFSISPFIGKNPVDVYRYLFEGDAAAASRQQLLDESGTTLRDALLGLVAGTVAAVTCGIAFHLSRTASSVFMPMAMVLRSVPLVAMTPLIVAIFGRNLGAITIISGIVTFFPTLVNMLVALRGTPRESLDLCRAYGASASDTLWKVQVPTALPAVFASLRIAAPLSLVGALLAEWLATGQGLGYGLLNASAESDYNGLWARVVLITFYSAILYQLVGIAEGLVMKRFGPGPQ
jgi:ABC-type nitrate/sulfonate/bicarbonate transport system permease component